MSNDDKWQDTRNSVNYVSKNIFAILGIIFGFLVAPVGLVLSIIGKNKAQQDGDSSSAKLAKIGMIISIVVMVIELIAFVSVLAVGCSAQKDAIDLADKVIDGMGNMKIGM